MIDDPRDPMFGRGFCWAMAAVCFAGFGFGLGKGEPVSTLLLAGLTVVWLRAARVAAGDPPITFGDPEPFRCPGCGAALQLSLSLIGSTVSCPHCGTTLETRGHIGFS